MRIKIRIMNRFVVLVLFIGFFDARGFFVVGMLLLFGARKLPKLRAKLTCGYMNIVSNVVKSNHR